MALSHFLTRYLEKHMKIWHHFFFRLQPASHNFEVSREQAFALFAIATNLSMSVGEYIHSSIRYAINNNNVGLAFPSLPTELFEKAGVDIVDNSICQPIQPLDHNGILQIWSNQPEEIEEEADSSRQVANRKSKAKVTTSDLYNTI